MRNNEAGPVERAAIGADRSYARSQMLDQLTTDIALGYATCARCERRKAVGFGAINGRPAAVCAICRDDLTLDKQIAAGRRQRDRMRR